MYDTVRITYIILIKWNRLRLLLDKIKRQPLKANSLWIWVTQGVAPRNTYTGVPREGSMSSVAVRRRESERARVQSFTYTGHR